jgi:tetratricopeptide (TPR) repeat protein
VKTNTGGAVILDLERPNENPRFINHPIGWLGLSPDAKWLASNAQEGYESKLWDARTGKWVRDFPGMRNAEVVFSPNNRWLVFATARAYLFYHTGSWEPGPRVAREGAGYGLGHVAFARDGKMAAIAYTPRTIRLIECETGCELATLESPVPQELTSLCFTPDADRLAAGTAKGVIQVWDLRRIRVQLRALGLDWDGSLEPPSREAADEKPLQAEVDFGTLLDREKYSLILAFFPFHAEACYRRGLAYRRLNQDGLALADFSRAIVLDPKHADAYHQRARAYTDLRQWEIAVKDYSEALRHKPGEWELWNGRGYLNWILQRWDQAVADFSHALELNAGDSLLWSNRGVNYVELGRWQEAVADFSHALERNDGAGWIWNRRGLAHAALGQWDMAEANFAKAALLEPGNSSLWIERALANLAFGKREDYQKVCADALERFGQTTNPKEAAWLASICVLVPNAVTDAARPVQLARRAIADQPQDYPAARALGAALMRAGELEAAVRELQRASALQKEAPTTWLLLAMAHHRLGHADEARHWLDKGLQWIQHAARKSARSGDSLSAWQCIPWGERLGLLFLRLDAEAMINGTPPKREGDYPSVIRAALARP